MTTNVGYRHGHLPSDIINLNIIVKGTMEMKTTMEKSSKEKTINKNSFFYELKTNKIVYLMMLPAILCIVIFKYIPMFGLVVAFQDYTPAVGVLGSEWIGFDNFIRFFKSPYLVRCIKNTLCLSIYGNVVGFLAMIIMALLLNELRCKWFKKTVQTITYIPHFVSVVVVSGMIMEFCSQDGILNDIIVLFGGDRANLLLQPHLFKTIYIFSDLWTELGWGSIVYLAALTGIDPTLYDAASIDGAGRLKQTWHITIPGIMPTVVTMFLLRIGGLMSVGFEKIILLWNPSTYETAETISTYVYRKGLMDMNFGFSSAIGLFNSVINLAFVLFGNWLSKKYNDMGLW